MYKKKVLPIYWLVLNKKGSSNLAEQKWLIKPVLWLLKKYKFVVIGDIEFYGLELSHWLKKLKLPQKISFFSGKKWIFTI